MVDAPNLIIVMVFVLSFAAISAIFALSFAALFRDDFEFFPPPSNDSWQHGAFRGLFRLYLYPLIVLSALVFEPESGPRALVQYGIGALMLVLGFGFAFLITVQMGWRNAFGEKLGLKTDGWFRWSRNPVYVATWIGLIGWGLIAAQILVVILLLLWGLMYVLAPIFEEPWLERAYGDDYLAYKKRTRRFI